MKAPAILSKETPKTDALAAKLCDLGVTGDAAALALLDHANKLERVLWEARKNYEVTEADRLRLKAENAALREALRYWLPDGVDIAAEQFERWQTAKTLIA